MGRSIEGSSRTAGSRPSVRLSGQLRCGVRARRRYVEEWLRSNGAGRRGLHDSRQRTSTPLVITKNLRAWDISQERESVLAAQRGRLNDAKRVEWERGKAGYELGQTTARVREKHNCDDKQDIEREETAAIESQTRSTVAGREGMSGATPSAMQRWVRLGVG